MSRAYTSLPAIIASEQGQLCPAACEQEDLLLELALSVWLKTSDLGLEEARASMLALRRALLDLGRFDRATEPIPLLSRDGRQALVDLARYLADLAERASITTGRSAPDLVIEALDRLPRAPERPERDEEPALATILVLRRP